MKVIDQTKCCRSNEKGGGWAPLQVIYKTNMKVTTCTGCGNYWDIERVESQIECHYCGSPAEIDIDSMEAYCCNDNNKFKLTLKQQEMILEWLVSE